jgi:hypothetical protein
MTASTPAEVARAYPNTPGPVYLFTAPSDPAHISLVPFAMPPMPPMPPMPLSKLKAVLETQMGGPSADFRWSAREVIEVEGRGWVHLEFVSRAPAGMLHQHLLVGHVKNGLLMVELAAPESTYPAYRDAFLRTIQSVRVRE